VSIGMVEETSTAQGEEPEICSVDSLQKVCLKHPKLLLISTKKEREGFIQKFTDVAVPEDMEVVALETGGTCEIVEKLGMKDACKAVLIEKGKVKREINLQNDDVKDAINLMKMLIEDKKGRPRKDRVLEKRNLFQPQSDNAELVKDKG
jgi:hypothetical protein